MAHGFYRVTRRPQALMLHVSVGTANGVMGLMNAARDQVPVFFTAGRTPLFEEGGRRGSRSGDINWAQEMYDQAGMVREFVKWDYELRDGINVESVVDRAIAIMSAAPAGPIYLTLPREVLAQPLDGIEIADGPATLPSGSFPDPAAVTALARKIADAELPVIVTQASGADPATVPLLAALCERYAIAHVNRNSRTLNLPASHPMNLGSTPDSVYPEADTLLFLESDVPWLERTGKPRPDAFIAQAGTDPALHRLPDADVPRRSAAHDRRRGAADRARPRARNRRRDAPAGERRARIAGLRAQAEDAVAGRPPTRAARRPNLEGLSLAVPRPRPSGERDPRERVLGGVRSDAFRRARHVDDAPAGRRLGLGFSGRARRQASRTRTRRDMRGRRRVVYLRQPGGLSSSSAMHALPIVTVVFNNEWWSAVHMATLGVYPDTHAAAYKKTPLSDISPSPAYERVCEAAGGYGERVTEREQLVPALKRALDVVRNEKRQVFERHRPLKLSVSLACWDYDRTRALRDGRVPVDGVDLIDQRLEVEETFFRMLRYREFDACEMSLVVVLPLEIQRRSVHRDPGLAVALFPPLVRLRQQRTAASANRRI